MPILKYIIGALFLFSVILLGVRFFAGGNEDTWICQNGQWVRHGNPHNPQPTEACPETTFTSSSEPKTSGTEKVLVYFNNSKRDPDYNCTAVYSVERTIEPTQAVATAALGELFKGPSDDEKEQGYTSLFSGQTADILKSIKIVDGTAYVNLKDIRSIIPNASSSCGTGVFMSQVGVTLKQFNTVQNVIYAIEGNPQTFYDWIQIGCSKENNNCDSTPFK